LKIISGRIGTENEVISIRRQFSEIYKIDLKIDLEVHHHQSILYVRLEGFTKHTAGGNVNGFCYTNPIWIQHL
jgi:hypothetical protein